MLSVDKVLNHFASTDQVIIPVDGMPTAQFDVKIDAIISAAKERYANCVFHQRSSLEYLHKTINDDDVEETVRGSVTLSKRTQAEHILLQAALQHFNSEICMLKKQRFARFTVDTSVLPESIQPTDTHLDQCASVLTKWLYHLKYPGYRIRAVKCLQTTSGAIVINASLERNKAELFEFTKDEISVWRKTGQLETALMPVDVGYKGEYVPSGASVAETLRRMCEALLYEHEGHCNVQFTCLKPKNGELLRVQFTSI